MSAQEPLVTGRPCLCPLGGNGRLIEELADLLAAALITDLRLAQKHLESKTGDNPTVVSPRGPRHD